MPVPSPLHSRTAPLSVSHEWRNWSGYLAASLYEPTHEFEYFAIRNSAALLDVSPLYKYEIQGTQALQLVNRIVTRDINKCAVGQVMYTPWCDDNGKVIDDGTVSRLTADHFRITAADPNLAWFQDCGYRMQASVEDVSSKLAAMALQGPHSRDILKEVIRDIDFDSLKYYRLGTSPVDSVPVTVTRTGYTGDLGYELWIEAEYAGQLWDRLFEVGIRYGLAPAGMIALDIARIEAGLIMIGVDYISSRAALIPDQESSPYDIGLDWAVSLDKGEFVGRKALLAESENGSHWACVGLEVDWVSLEDLFAAVDLPPQVAGRPSRLAAPVYKNGRQVGHATSHTFSPILKKYIAIATVETPFSTIGERLQVEFTVEYARRKAKAVVVMTPFYDPPRKRA